MSALGPAITRAGGTSARPASSSGAADRNHVVLGRRIDDALDLVRHSLQRTQGTRTDAPGCRRRAPRGVLELRASFACAHNVRPTEIPAADKARNGYA